QDFGFNLKGVTDSGSTRQIQDVFHYFGAGITVMLPARNRNEGNIAAAGAEATAAERRREFSELIARQEVAAALAQYEAARRTVELYGRGVRGGPAASVRATSPGGNAEGVAISERGVGRGDADSGGRRACGHQDRRGSPSGGVGVDHSSGHRDVQRVSRNEGHGARRRNRQGRQRRAGGDGRSRSENGGRRQHRAGRRPDEVSLRPGDAERRPSEAHPDRKTRRARRRQPAGTRRHHRRACRPRDGGGGGASAPFAAG